MSFPKPKILFVTRKFPPSVGGMEKVNYELSKEFSKITPTRIVSWGGSQKWLAFIYPYLFFKALVLSFIFDPDVVYLGDGVMTPTGFLLKKITKKKVVCVLHGLDVTYQLGIYQKIIPSLLNRLDLLICVSSQTKKECLKRGIGKDKVVVIPNGINPKEFKVKSQNNVRRKTTAYLSKKLSVNLGDKKILLTVGRLVKRKGHAWFIKNVMPKLSPETIYLIAGDGPEKENVLKEISENDLRDRVFLLGRVSDELKKNLYNSADLFVMPNINVKGDMEGFGIVALEASSAGLPTIASKIEGIKDAVKDGENGFLLKEKDAISWQKTITSLLISDEKGDSLRKRTLDFSTQFSWNKIASKHLLLLKK